MGHRTKVFAVGVMVVVLGGLSLLVAGSTGAEDRPVVRVDRIAAPELQKAPEPVARIPASPERAAKEDSNEKPDKKAHAKEDKKKKVESQEKIEKKVRARAPERKAEHRALRAVASDPVPADTTLSLTVPKMGLYDNPVINTTDPAVLDQGAVKLPQTGFPWQNNANTYIAAHALGYAGTGSYMQFANLPNMTYGDEIILTDANGTTYTYRVTEVMTVTPYDTWVMNPVPGKTMVTLQTCVNPPAYDQRLVVRGELTG